MKKQGFTLAEVLITLAIIGVVAAMTIPSVIVRTNQQEFRTGAKKALSSLSSAIQLVEAQDGISLEEAYNGDPDKFMQALYNKLNIIKTDEDSEFLTFYTADGFRYSWVDPTVFIVDVNGDKGPTTIDTSRAQWKEATYNSYDDIENPEWPDVHLSDLFIIGFNPNTGASIMYPYTGQLNPDNEGS